MNTATTAFLAVGGVILAICALVALIERSVSRREPPAERLPLDEVVPPKPPPAPPPDLRWKPCDCDMHNQHCEPPADLCCGNCTEVNHPLHPPRERCVLDSIPELPDPGLQPAPDKSWLKTEGPRHRGRYRI